jgi:low affinity Fe/Cu permease
MIPGDVKADNKGQSPRSTGVADVIASDVDAKAWFFVACVLLVVIRARTFVFPPVETWQLIIKTTAMMTTLLLAALQQNDMRDEKRALREAVGLEHRESTR